jgi:hypothetical protein
MSNRDFMNRGRRRRTLPDLKDSRVEFVSCRRTNKMDPMKWTVTLKVNGWPHDIGMWAKDELDVMKQVFEMQRGREVVSAFDISR